MSATLMRLPFLIAGLALLVPLSASAAVFTRNLSIGATGADVATLQQFLTDEALYSGPISATFGPLTRAAVIRFQVQEGIMPAAGFLGPTTRTHANAILDAHPQSTSAASTYGHQTKTTACLANTALPDPACTPGAILTTDVPTVCTPGYTKTVRDVPLSEAQKVFAEYGIPYSDHGNYEVDHLISLELGGSNDISNLWPEPHANPFGSFVKDQLENHLHAQVCSGAITIQAAQDAIASNWTTANNAMPHASPIFPTTAQALSVPPTDVSPLEALISKPFTPPAAVPPTSPASPTTTTNTAADIPAGATSQCSDGTYSFSASHSGTCSHHGGVARWLQ
jgi:peptidoglycan hydrolase-like protein with peptidoglycan-binding domain